MHLPSGGVDWIHPIAEDTTARITDAELKGWSRLKVAQDWLNKVPAQRTAAQTVPIDPTLARAQAARAAPGRPADQERLFQEFLEWSQKQKK